MNKTTSLPLISIVTASLNQGDFLGEALRSVRLQEEIRHEHLVLDGGSTDCTIEILRDACELKVERTLSWRSRHDGGQSQALNEGFARARGEIVGWLNADDRYRADCFAHVARTFAEHPEIDILYGDYTFVDKDGRHLKLRREIEFNHFILKYHRVLYIPTTATFFRRKIFDEGNFLREDLHYAMDLDFFLRLAQKGYRFMHLPCVLADFRIHAGSKSQRSKDEHRKEHRKIVRTTTPLAHRLRSPSLRAAAASLLQIPAAAMRWAEKLLRGFYFPNRSAMHFAEEQIRGVERL